jgi:hypothetical protein
MDDDEITVLTADYMYLVILSSPGRVEQITEELDKKNDNIKYVMMNIDDPCANIKRKTLDKLFKTKSSNLKYVIFREGTESAQPLTFAEGYDRSLFMILEVENTDDAYYIGFPRLNLEEEIEPEKMIESWVKTNNLRKTMSKVYIKPIHVVGNENEILVFAAKVGNIR